MPNEQKADEPQPVVLAPWQRARVKALQEARGVLVREGFGTVKVPPGELIILAQYIVDGPRRRRWWGS